jgi:hypothetical protein
VGYADGVDVLKARHESAHAGADALLGMGRKAAVYINFLLEIKWATKSAKYVAPFQSADKFLLQ